LNMQPRFQLKDHVSCRDVYSTNVSFRGLRAIGKGRSYEIVCHQVTPFFVSEDGPTAVEYAVMLALIICVCLAAITTIGTNASAVFSSVAKSI